MRLSALFERTHAHIQVLSEFWYFQEKAETKDYSFYSTRTISYMIIRRMRTHYIFILNLKCTNVSAPNAELKANNCMPPMNAHFKIHQYTASRHFYTPKSAVIPMADTVNICQSPFRLWA